MHNCNNNYIPALSSPLEDLGTRLDYCTYIMSIHWFMKVLLLNATDRHYSRLALTKGITTNLLLGLSKAKQELGKEPRVAKLTTFLASTTKEGTESQILCATPDHILPQSTPCPSLWSRCGHYVNLSSITESSFWC